MSESSPLSKIHYLAYPLLLATIGFLVLRAPASQATVNTPGASAEEVSASTGDVVATLNGEEILRSEVLESAASALEQVDQQELQCEIKARENRHAAVENTLERLIQQRLIASGAAAVDMTPDEWRRAEMEELSAAVTEDEITTFYNQNRNRVQGTKEQLAGQIRTYLAGVKFNDAIREGAEIDVTLEPYRVDVAVGDGVAKGPADAPVTIIEFSDFECPFCRRVAPTLDRITDNYGDKVRLVFRQFPLPSLHPNAMKASEAALCANDQGSFWDMHDLMFAEQKDLAVDSLKDKANRLGLDTAQFNECLDGGKYQEQVGEDMRAGSLVGVTGTPAFFVNGRPMSGAVPYDQLAEVIEEELAASGR